MMKSIFYGGKKNYVGDQKLKDWKKWFVVIHNVLWRIMNQHYFFFLLIMDPTFIV
jgi:hypothetical protein